MSAHLIFSENLTKASYDQAISRTHLGQAHFAGTGPDGKTCRECAFFHNGRGKRAWNGKRKKTDPLKLKDQRCHRPIMNKAKRKFPHHAGACRLFEQSANPPLASLEEVK